MNVAGRPASWEAAAVVTNFLVTDFRIGRVKILYSGSVPTPLFYGKFPAGTEVNIVETAGSYTLVRSQDGVKAYVAADAVQEIETGDRQP